MNTTPNSGSSIAGFGYEGLTQQELVSQIVAAGVTILADVRLNPISRKRGLSKTALREALAVQEIRYLHLPNLGNPKWNREGFATLDQQARKTYQQLLLAPEAQHDLTTIQTLSSTETVGLLCFEANPAHCHREVLLALLNTTASPNPTQTPTCTRFPVNSTLLLH